MGLAVIVLVYNLFLIRHIQCSLNSKSCPEGISQKLQSYLGSSAIFLNQESLSDSLKLLYPLEEIHLSFKVFNTLEVVLAGSQLSYNAKTYLVKELPLIAMDIAPGSTLSADWVKPTVDLETFIADKDGQNFDLWSNGTMTPSATSEANIIYIFKEKPDSETLINIFKTIRILSRYLDLAKIYIADHRLFLRQEGQPDIIVYVPSDEDSLVEALQSFAYLATIKKDAKVVDLRFKNPIIR